MENISILVNGRFVVRSIGLPKTTNIKLETAITSKTVAMRLGSHWYATYEKNHEHIAPNLLLSNELLFCGSCAAME